MFNIIAVRSHGEYPEESGKNILAFCYPGNRLHMKGMYRKQSGYKGTWPKCLCHPVKDKKKEYGAHHMEKKIHYVKPERVKAEDLIVKHQ
jgi:hypothetical protein